ncbi:MAG: type II secretion system F family protein [Gemmataceae bacterium]
MLSRELPTDVLIELSRSLRHNLDAGLSLVEVMRQQARKGPAALRPVAERIIRTLERGDDLASALDEEADHFPLLFRELARVGEQTGNLPDVFAALQKYYEGQARLRRLFVAQSMMPAAQFFVAIFVVAGLIFLLGWIAEARNGPPIDPLGLGLVGAKGAVTFLLIVFGTLGGLLAGYLLASRSLKHQASVDRLLLRVPVLGPCLEALALGRFCLAMRLTLETSLSTHEAVKLGLRASGNAAYASEVDTIGRAVKKGGELARALGKAGIFPDVFLNIVASAEEGGRLPEVMRQQARFYEEEAEHRLLLLTRAAGFTVWLVVAAFIIFAIYRIFTQVYLAQLDNMMR